MHQVKVVATKWKSDYEKEIEQRSSIFSIIRIENDIKQESCKTVPTSEIYLLPYN